MTDFLGDMVRFLWGLFYIQDTWITIPKNEKLVQLTHFWRFAAQNTDEPLFSWYFCVKYDVNCHFLEFVFNNPAFVYLSHVYAIISGICSSYGSVVPIFKSFQVFFRVLLMLLYASNCLKKRQNGVILNILLVVPFPNYHFTELSHLI